MADDLASLAAAASPGGVASEIIGSLSGVTLGVLDYMGDGATEQAAAQAAAAQAQAAAVSSANANTAIGWASANPLTAAGVLLGALYLLSQIARR
tara:strand:- start:1333 stop:1617 length:285 start_codon:yes stop_codon:yes gene_type:complete